MLNHGSKALLGLAGVTMAFGLAACGSDESSDSGSSSSGDSGGSGKIALLLPESKTTRYESQDKPLFEAKVKELCSGCEVLYSNADQDASKQQQQAEAAITNGAKVLVLDPVDADSAGAIVKRAQESDIKVISYDRLIGGGSKPDFYISYDNAKVGELQATSLVEQLGGTDGVKGKQIVMINGAPTDSNAGLFKKGAHSVFDKSGVKIGKEYDTPDWSPDKAQDEMDQAITSLGKDKIDGVYAANDGTAGGAIAAMKAAGMDPTKVPSTGQDAELAGVQRVLAGEQGMTVYKAIKPEAGDAATLAVALVQGKEAPSGLVNGKQNNGTADIPAIIYQPQAVTKDNVKDTIVADGFWKVDELCTSAYADACKAAGIS
ncbi:MAG: sugar ABC transporter substrate-binding protein [Solirubrobacteraceae bacterium]|nr:sugar ABC transporter substrate-binding protein [Solirubrobacteraceae bacterium]